MKFSYLKIIVYSIILFHINFCFPEGFAIGTLIKVPAGYAKIEELLVGDYVSCYDAENNLTQGLITHLFKKTVDHYLSIQIGDESICMACDQQLYDENTKTWIISESLRNDHEFCRNNFTITFIDEPIDFYLLGIEKYHNFIVSHQDIRVHNFVPIIVGITVAFGAGSLEIAGISCGIAGLGSYLGYQWHKKHKQQHTIVAQCNYGGGMMPEDPEEEKKRKRDEARENFRPLTNKEAREQAEKLGYKEVKNHPCGTNGELAFKKGNVYISPDNTGHNGGIWKMFKRNGRRTGTWNRNLTERIKS